MKKLFKFLTVIFLLGAVFIFFRFDLGRFVSLNYLKEQKLTLDAYTELYPARVIASYLMVYIACTALSLPGAAILTLAGGALFGLWRGTFMVSVASSVGATLAFLVSRFLLRDVIQLRFREKLATVNEGVSRDGSIYLFTLRLIPVFPFFVVNLVMGLTPMPIWQFFFVSQLGMLPGTFVFVNAGTQIGQLESVQGILSPPLLFSFALLGFFPLVAKKAIELGKARKLMRRVRRPRRFDYNVVVIGAGSGGLVSAYIAATVKAKVALIEKHKMGGDCLNTGCVPSKALIKSARVLSSIRRHREFGFRQASVDFDFGEVMERVQRVIKKVAPHDSVERYRSLGVECFEGTAKIVTPYTVEVAGKTLTTRSIIIATGGRPAGLQLKGADQIHTFDSDTIWDLRKRPERLLVLGGGPIGCELAQCFERLGSKVTLVQRGPVILPREDREASDQVLQSFRRDGMTVLVDHVAKEFRIEGEKKFLICEHAGQEITVPFDEALVALGRRANVTGFGLEDLEIRLTPQKTIETDSFLRTNYPNIFAVGDVAGPYQFTHTASHQAWYAAVNSLFGHFKKFRVDYRVVPWCTFTDPEVARVGLSETEAKAKGIPHEVTLYGIDDLDRAIADEEDHGLVKILTVPGSDRILGAMITGDHAGDYIVEFVAAMKHGFGLNKILSTIHIYPTLGEANKYAAGVWKRNHVPQRVLTWVERYHRWMRQGLALLFVFG